MVAKKVAISCHRLCCETFYFYMFFAIFADNQNDIKMIKKLLGGALALAAIVMFTRCQQVGNAGSSNADSLTTAGKDNTPVSDTSLYAILECETATPHLTDSLIINFTVTNPTKDTLKFTAYHTPFEGMISKFLTVKDADGNEASYLGPMAKRMMPPPADTYHTLAPGQSESVRFDLKKGYKIEKAGTYTIQYNGELISGVANGQAIKVDIAD